MNIFKRIFNRKSKPTAGQQALQQRITAATQAAAALQDLLNTGPKAKAEPEYYVLSLTEEERRSLMKATAKGMYYNIPGIETAELTNDDRSRALDILFRLKATTGSQQEISQDGQLVTFTTVLL